MYIQMAIKIHVLLLNVGIYLLNGITGRNIIPANFKHITLNQVGILQ